jgi:hypothetical protein
MGGFMKNETLVPWTRVAAKLARAVVGLFAFLAVQAQQAPEPGTITWFMPLEKAAGQLQQRYGKPVTYEDPARMWHAEMEVAGTLHGQVVLRVKRHTLAMPQESIDKAPALTAELVAGILYAYHQQNPDQARFRVIESRMGFHIVPTRVHDQNGLVVPVVSPFDAEISVSVQTRTASEHLAALCDAVTAATGVTVQPLNPWFDRYFAANGYLLPQVLTGKERPYMLFEWGTSQKVARDALIDLMDGSGSTLTWILHCGQTSGRPDTGCDFQMAPLQVGPTRRLIFYDRCSNCRPIPK